MTQIVDIMLFAYGQSMQEQLALHRAGIVHSFLHPGVNLLPKSWNRRHTRGMCLAHRLLNLSRIGIDDELCTLRKREIRPRSLEDMGERQKADHPICFAHVHAFVVGLQGSVILTVSEHYPFAIACGAAGVENIAQILLIGLGPELFHLALTWQMFAQFQEIVEVKSVRIVRTDAHTAVENDDAFQRMAKGEDAMSLVILLLFSYKEESDLSIVHHILQLLFAAGGIKGDRHGPNAIRTEVGIEIMNAVLREDADVFLGFNAEVEQGIAHLFYSGRKLIP